MYYVCVYIGVDIDATGEGLVTGVYMICRCVYVHLQQVLDQSHLCPRLYTHLQHTCNTPATGVDIDAAGEGLVAGYVAYFIHIEIAQIVW